MHARLRGVVMTAALLTPVLASAEGETPDQGAAPTPGPPTKTEPAKPAPAVEIAPAPPPESDAASAFTWKPFGFLRMQYIAVQNDPNVAFVGRDDGFELQNARVGALGRMGTRAAFVVAFDGAVDERAQVNSPDGKLRVGLR